MASKINDHIIDILAAVSNLREVTGNTAKIEGNLNLIRESAVGLLEGKDKASEELLAGLRITALDQVSVTEGCIMSAGPSWTDLTDAVITDQQLFRIAAAADHMVDAVDQYISMRNRVSAARLDSGRGLDHG